VIAIKIDVKQVDKTRLFPSKDGGKKLYLDLILFENKNGTDQYGNDGFVKQGQSKEERLAGKQTPIIGNWKHLGIKNGPQKPAPAADTAADDDVPF
jgi:hypothetical protein